MLFISGIGKTVAKNTHFLLELRMKLALSLRRWDLFDPNKLEHIELSQVIRRIESIKA